MALISINDLPQSDALDREAMRSIVGGGRIGPRLLPIDQVRAGAGRLVEYPPGFDRQGPPAAGPNRAPTLK